MRKDVESDAIGDIGAVRSLDFRDARGVARASADAGNLDAVSNRGDRDLGGIRRRVGRLGSTGVDVDWYLFSMPSEAGGRARRALARLTASVAC